jgi:putative PIN family toxin of toxin-antitoxin system
MLTLVLAEHELILGEEVLAELERVLRQKLKVPSKRVAEVTGFLRAQARVVEAKARPLIKLRDPTDVKIVAEAIAGEAEILVTGDRDLLSAKLKLPFPIVTPRGFWEQLRAQRNE